MLMFKSLLRLQRVDAGVRIENVITMSADLPRRPIRTPERAARFYRAGGRAAPGDPRRRAGRGLDGRAAARRQAGRSRDAAWRRSRASRRGSSASIRNYFATLDIPVLAGRGFSPPRPRRRAARRHRQRIARPAAGANALAIADPARAVGRTVPLANPLYENRGQSGKAEDVEIVGMIRNERVQRPRDARCRKWSTSRCCRRRAARSS